MPHPSCAIRATRAALVGGTARPPGPARSRQRGLTLVEIMVSVVIVGILTAVAIPGYQDYIRRAARSDAQLTLQQVSSWLERRYAECNSYIRINAASNPPCTEVLAASDLPAELKRSPSGSGGGTKRYDVTISSLAAQSYTLQAVPVDSNDKCGTFELTSVGVRSVTGPLGNDNCWRR